MQFAWHVRSGQKGWGVNEENKDEDEDENEDECGKSARADHQDFEFSDDDYGLYLGEFSHEYVVP